MTPATVTAATRDPMRVPSGARHVSGAALTALVAALVLGILGMHALATHGTTAPATAGISTAASSTASSTAMTGMSSHVAATPSASSHDGHGHASAATVPGSPVDGHGSHDVAAMNSMVMLCVVMLAAAALTLLLLLAVRVLRQLLPDAFGPAAARERIFQWIRGTGPPSNWQFSVIRC